MPQDRDRPLVAARAAGGVADPERRVEVRVLRLQLLRQRLRRRERERRVARGLAEQARARQRRVAGGSLRDSRGHHRCGCQASKAPPSSHRANPAAATMAASPLADSPTWTVSCWRGSGLANLAYPPVPRSATADLIREPKDIFTCTRIRTHATASCQRIFLPSAWERL